ncbi:putative membrane protein [Wickerhamomyces ciferrii]|uniref:Polyprenal reductase n=1 Tax=Wickerhamomyces ciferrii (strain ATCC 14091 / BCRC 22168 / CBS 111 / JCM 3599 / NBRC 0793 / NRRL Y-1031 F-60-10) TaxID=1206466 RepID=K0KG24_WICCF|nr:uncharacterized protein BN7_1425 [Wickerhamomyces ciferrii]CCH41886.1 putative membrane protein [Wickerhamomyces ciferrii]
MDFQKADQLLQLLYVGAIGSVVLAKFYPKLNGFLKYGKTLQTNDQSEDNKQQEEIKNDKLVEPILKIQTPKSWFYHFYIISLTLSTISFGLLHYSLETKDESFVKFFQNSYGSISPRISRLGFFLIAVHSFRRLAESLFIFNYGKESKMNISHYLVGLFFYSAINISLLLNTSFNSSEFQNEPELDFKLFAPLFLFLTAFSDQFLNHFHLSKIVKYNLPRFGLFQYICSAHYFDEILIYSSLYLLLGTTTSLFSLAFVIVNLTVSSIETRNYYKVKHETGKIPRWSIIPFVI